MYKLNFIQYPEVQEINLDERYSLQALRDNNHIDKLKKEIKTKFAFDSLNTFSFSKAGFLELMLQLGGKIIVSKGESQAIVDGGIEYQKLGFNLEFIDIKKDGTLNYEQIKKCDYAFISSYIMDTYVKVDLQRVKSLSKGVIVSNISADLEAKSCDVAILDAYKLTGFSLSALALHNNLLEEQPIASIDTVGIATIKNALNSFKVNKECKKEFKEALKEEFKEDIYFFVDSNKSLEYTLHFGLKGIKARELIRSLALSNIFVTNGEGCSLGLSKPSRIIQEMGYEEAESRWALSLSFKDEFTKEEIALIVKTMGKKYRQIKRLSQ